MNLELIFEPSAAFSGLFLVDMTGLIKSLVSDFLLEANVRKSSFRPVARPEVKNNYVTNYTSLCNSTIDMSPDTHIVKFGEDWHSCIMGANFV